MTNFMNSLFRSKFCAPSIHLSASSQLSEDDKGMQGGLGKQRRQEMREGTDVHPPCLYPFLTRFWAHMNEPDKWGAVCTQMKVGDRETERRICILGRDKGLVESQCQCHVCQHCHDPITPSSMPPAPTLVTIHVTQILIQIYAQHKYKNTNTIPSHRAQPLVTIYTMQMPCCGIGPILVWPKTRR